MYQGAPTSVAAFIGSVPKIAATVFAFRILVEGLALQKGDWLLIFAALAVLSLLIGNLAAIMQTNIKRMFAFSTISHMGFVLLAFLGHFIGLQAAIYYAITYILMSLAGFGVLMLLSREDKECEEISDLAGLNQRNAWYAFVMLLVLFSMAGASLKRKQEQKRSGVSSAVARKRRTVSSVNMQPAMVPMPTCSKVREEVMTGTIPTKISASRQESA